MNSLSRDPLNAAVPGNDEFADRLRVLLARSADDYVSDFQQEIVRFCNAANNDVIDLRQRALCRTLAPYLLYRRIQIDRDEAATPWPVPTDLDRAADHVFTQDTLETFEEMADHMVDRFVQFIASARRNLIVPMVGSNQDIATAALIGAVLRTVEQ